MAKNLLSQRKFRDEVDRAANRGVTLCWKTNKVKFRNEEAAWESALHEKKFKQVELYVYKCWACGLWHLTKEPQ